MKVNILSINVNNFGGAIVKPIVPRKPSANDKNYEIKWVEYTQKKEELTKWNATEKERMKRANDIADWIMKQQVDLVILQEFEHGSEATRSFEGKMKDKFDILKHKCYDSNKKSKYISSIVTLLAAKKSSELYSPPTLIQEDCPAELNLTGKWINVIFHADGHELNVIGVHIPGGWRKKDSKNFWDVLIEHTKSIENCVIIGDMNVYKAKDCAENKDSANAGKQKELEGKNKFHDAFRCLYPDKTEFTHYVEGRIGRRLDYAYVSDTLKSSIIEVRHISDVNVHDKKSLPDIAFTDHSAVLIELEC